MGSNRMPMLPPRWLNCPRMGSMIVDIFIPFKTPLDSKFDNFMEPEHIFHVDDVFQACEPYKLGFVLDLTKSKRFYNRREVLDMNCKHLKIECKGNEETPTQEQVDLFIRVVNQFLDSSSGDEKVGVHCTHGFNRTGFMIIAYLVEELNYGVDIAVKIFADARPPGIYKADYLEDLFTRYGNKEDCAPAPVLPAWCIEDGDSDRLHGSKRPHALDDDFDGGSLKQTSSSSMDKTKLSRYDNSMAEAVSIGSLPAQRYPTPPKGTPKLMDGVSHVITLDQDSPEAHEARELADRLFRMGGCMYENGQPVFPNAQSSEGEDDSSEPATSNENTKRFKHPLRFRGSQPVSITQRNIEALISFDYCVSYKADGCRYLLLVSGPNQVYMIDRANFVYRVEVLHFPSVAWVKCVQQSGNIQSHSPSEFLSVADGHLRNTLLDGEMVLCHDPSKPPPSIHEEVTSGIPRFLIYDIVTLNSKPVGRSPFFERYSIIDKQVIWPRNTAGHLGLVNFGIQSFSVRRKQFRPLKETEELLKQEFIQSLDHVTDGLIFQPCGPDEFYVLGTCYQQLKWKPPHLNTVDFRCKIVYEAKVGEIPGYVGHLYLGGLNTPAAKLAHVGPKDKVLDGKIVECSLIPNLGWKVLRIRTDKTEPNYHKSGKAVIESIMFPVTAQNILMCVYQRGQKLAKSREVAGPSMK